MCRPRAGRGRAAGDQGTAAGGPGLAKPKERLRETRSPRGPGGSTRRGRGRLQRGPGQRPAASLRVCLPATARRGGPSPLKCRAAAAEPAGSVAGGPTRAPRATRVRAGRDDRQLGRSHAGRGPRQGTGRTAGFPTPQRGRRRRPWPPRALLTLTARLPTSGRGLDSETNSRS